MNIVTETPTAAPRMAHETATRIRFRWNRLLDPSLRPDYLEAWLANLPGVDRARVNPRGRTFVIDYDGDKDHRRELLKAFAAIPAQAFEGTGPIEPRRRLADAVAHGGAALALPFTPPAVQAVAGTAMGLPHVLRGLDTLGEGSTVMSNSTAASPRRLPGRAGRGPRLRPRPARPGPERLWPGGRRTRPFPLLRP